jgi:hypothetical protein
VLVIVYSYSPFKSSSDRKLKLHMSPNTFNKLMSELRKFPEFWVCSSFLSMRIWYVFNENMMGLEVFLGG